MKFNAGDKVRLVSVNYATKAGGLSPLQAYTVADAAEFAAGAAVRLEENAEEWPVHLFEKVPEEHIAGLEGLQAVEAALRAVERKPAPIPVHAVGDVGAAPSVRRMPSGVITPIIDEPIPTFLTNTPRAGETAEQTAIRYAPNPVPLAPGHTDLMISPEAIDAAINQPEHYARWPMQPIEFIAVNDLPWWVANVVKYCMRYDAKDGLADMYKARSYLDMKIRMLEGVPRFWEQPVSSGR